MRLYLIRHGETVDNIAGVLAGVKDSQLTIHGLEQTRKLGTYFATQNIHVTHIFSSPLIRTSKTAQAILDAQIEVRKDELVKKLSVVKDANLIEQDFGSFEGKPFQARHSPGKKDRHTESRNDAAGFVEVETKESMGRRADAFMDQQLFPLIHNSGRTDLVIAIVSHGMLLSTFWRRMLRRIPSRSLVIAPEVTAARGSLILEHLGGWSNTGYLELDLKAIDQPAALVGTAPFANRFSPAQAVSPGQALAAPDSDATQVGSLDAVMSTKEAIQANEVATEPLNEEPEKAFLITQERPALVGQGRPTTFAGYQVTILAVDSKQHLTGLKRQRGGIGRLAVDDSQKKLTSFFKRPKTS